MKFPDGDRIFSSNFASLSPRFAQGLQNWSIFCPGTHYVHTTAFSDFLFSLSPPPPNFFRGNSLSLSLPTAYGSDYTYIYQDPRIIGMNKRTIWESIGQVESFATPTEERISTKQRLRFVTKLKKQTSKLSVHARSETVRNVQIRIIKKIHFSFFGARTRLALCCVADKLEITQRHVF